MTRKESGFRRKLENRLLDALAHFLHIGPNDISSADCLEEKRVAGEQCVALFAVETHAALAMSRSVENGKVGIEDWITRLEKECRLGELRIELIVDVHCLVPQRLEQLPVRLLAFGRKVLSVTAMYPDFDLLRSVGVVLDNRLCRTCVIEVPVCEDNGRRYDV